MEWATCATDSLFDAWCCGFEKGSIFNPKTIDILTLKLHFNKNNE